MSTIQLSHNGINAEVDTVGAWVTALSENGSDILFPRTTLVTNEGAEKQRGGCHVCLPHFGPGGESGLNQHGFGRELEWSVEHQSDTMLELHLENTHPQYRALTARLLYLLTDRELSMQLTLENTGDDALPIAPAFHPYFAHDEREVRLNKASLDLGSLAGTEFITGSEQALEVRGRSLHLKSTNLPVWAVWTDQLGNYVCVEPSYSGNSFVDSVYGAPYKLLSGQPRVYRFEIGW